MKLSNDIIKAQCDLSQEITNALSVEIRRAASKLAFAHAHAGNKEQEKEYYKLVDKIVQMNKLLMEIESDHERLLLSDGPEGWGDE